MTRWIVFAAILLASRSYAQSTAPRPAFEMASVKPSANCESGGRAPDVSPGRFDVPCTTLRIFIRLAYSAFVGANLNSRRIEVVGGPRWMDSDRYDISAKAEGGASAAQMAPMLQALLEDRFQVKVHMGSQDSPVYALTVAKGNPNLRPSKEGSCTPIDLTNLTRLPLKPGEPAPRYCGLAGVKRNGETLMPDWYGVTMAEFAGRWLPLYVMDRPIIDNTGLTGQFDIHLEFVRGSAPQGPMLLNGQPSPDLQAPPADSTGSSIFKALETQLGLKLSPTKAPLDVIIVDQAEKPSEN